MRWKTIAIACIGVAMLSACAPSDPSRRMRAVLDAMEARQRPPEPEKVLQAAYCAGVIFTRYEHLNANPERVDPLLQESLMAYGRSLRAQRHALLLHLSRGIEAQDMAGLTAEKDRGVADLQEAQRVAEACARSCQSSSLAVDLGDARKVKALQACHRHCDSANPAMDRAMVCDNINLLKPF